MGYCLQDRKFCTFEQQCARWAAQSGWTARKQQNKTKVPGQCDVLRKPLMPTDSPGRGQDALCLQAACSTLQPTNTTDTYLYIQPDYCSDLQHFPFCFLSFFPPPGQIITETAALLDTSQVGQQGICCNIRHASIHSHISTWDHLVQHSVASTACCKGRCKSCMINTLAQELGISLWSVTRLRYIFCQLWLYSSFPWYLLLCKLPSCLRFIHVPGALQSSYVIQETNITLYYVCFGYFSDHYVVFTPPERENRSSKHNFCLGLLYLL